MPQLSAKSDSARPAISLKAAVGRLASIYAPRQVPADPLALIVWENIGSLVDDERRSALFDEFQERIGLSASKIANAPNAILSDIARRGGINAQTRTERLRQIAAIANAECDGDLLSFLRTQPLARARRLLKKFPAIGDPGADKILLFSGFAALPSVDSNGLRVLVRLGFCSEEKSYAQTYKSAMAVLSRQGKSDSGWFKRAYSAFREHGKALCKRAAPICEPCPLDRVCAHRMTARL